MTDDLSRKTEIKVNTRDVIICSLSFALVFWVIGITFRYYVYVGGTV